jgi:hypothetical protein
MRKHFESQDAITHVLEKRTEGILSVSEAHGREMPGYLAAASDCWKEMGIVMLLAWLFLTLEKVPHDSAFLIFTAFGFGWLIWKTGRSGWLGWARLERLHRLIEQEKYEIEHHRPQEREELVALYGAKGFEGKLLDSVVDVLMADQDRLLKVMLEEEMGLTLEAYEHPLQQALGAAIGAALSLGVALCSFYFFSKIGMLIATFLLVVSGTILSAVFEKNRVIHAVVWNVSIAVLSFGGAYFLYRLMHL